MNKLDLKLPHWAAVVCAVLASACLVCDSKGYWPQYDPLLKLGEFIFGSLSGGIFAVAPSVLAEKKDG